MMTDDNKTAGGRATEAGMAFQAAVATWFAAQMLADTPIGSHFGLSTASNIVGLQCETGDALDDIVVHLEDGGAIYIQCKTRPSLTVSADSALGKTLEQLVGLYVQLGGTPLAAAADVALLAVVEDAPRSLDILEAGCRMFDHGGVWDAVIAQVPQDKRDALSLFKAHIQRAWEGRVALPLTGDHLVAMARLFRVRRFAEKATGSTWREASHLLGRRLFGADDAGAAPMESLMALCRTFIKTGAPVDRSGLLRALRSKGHVDISAPAFNKDIEALLTYSANEQRRLIKHTRLPLGQGIPINRDCLEPLIAAAGGGSLLVTGEPGAGKTGVLLVLAERLAKAPGPLVFLSVERLSGVALRHDLAAELKLGHDPIEVLAAWPGNQPGVLVIDALDASRGGPSEAVIASFIADAVEKVGARWSIVASIRSFDLRNGQRFRETFAGAPPDLNFAERGLDNVRHFHIPRLSSNELAKVSAASTVLDELNKTAPQQLQDLLKNIFNLSLAAELLDAGVEPQSIRKVSTQSELIRRYEDIRLPTQALQRAVKAVVAIMVQRRQLTVRAIDIENDAVDDVKKSGVLVAAGDRIAFAHHVLFDHIAGRFYLAWDDTEALRDQLSGDRSIGLVLGPALRFALEEVWQDDAIARTITWRFLANLAAEAEPDPVILSIALRTAAERVEEPTDVEGLCDMIVAASDPAQPVARLMSQLARFADMAIAERGRLAAPAALAWAKVALAAAAGPDPHLVDAARILLMTLANKADLADANVMQMFGAAGRRLLITAWSLAPENLRLSSAGIRFTARSFGSDPAASRALLQRILDDRFDTHASQEAPELAEAVGSIIPHDPDFVARIYATFFTRDVTDESETWIGGSASRILPLTSTRRQDYRHARWHLTEVLKPFLEANPAGGTAAVIGAVRGLELEKRGGELSAPTDLIITGRTVRVFDDLLSLQDWREERTHEEEPLTAFVDFLRSCEPDAFRQAVMTTLASPANAAVWARLLGTAADRQGVADDLLWPLASDPHFTALQGLARDAVIFLAASYAARPEEDRAAFERLALTDGLFPAGRASRWWRSVLGRLLSILSEELLATSEMRTYKADMAAAGELIGNQPFVTMSVGWGSTDNIVDSMLQSSGADLERSPDREIRTASRRVENDIKLSPDRDDATTLTALWGHVVELLATLDAGIAAAPHEQLVHSSWGAVCNGVERIAKSSAYEPGVNGLPDLDTLLALIDRLSASPYPEIVDAPSDQMGWGNWDVRVYAASSLVALAPRFADVRSDIVDRMQACLHDPAPTVRLQVAQAVNVLWDVAHERMWEMVTEIAETETHEGVLFFFIAGPLGPISREYPERCANLLSQLLEREWVKVPDEVRTDRDRDAEASANLAASLYVIHDQPAAWAWIDRWASDLRRGEAYVAPMLHYLRQVFFFPYGKAPTPDDLDIAARGRRILDAVTTSAAAALVQARPYLLGQPDEAAVATWRPLYAAADHLINQVCNQLYFGSGAYRSNTNDEPGLPDIQAKRRFLVDYAPILDIIANHAQSRTAHNLIELLAYLVEGDPTAVFDRIANILLGSAARDGYQFESLAVDRLVKLVRRYLADHRNIFEDRDRRQKLLEVLELFSSAGWPDALKLLFELPDLLR
ncbi:MULTISPECIES: ATP-binding protein [unclassified Mesorhizobium]|uniref:ATP-binding protein n=1 Tax=unclassified Mesorhizobium TaxID=325217 RepID=UPI002416F9EA|nr:MULTISPECIES: ATP-binding protein [unclassified Mesorhizobium]MDG4904520.1 ATP-binding protein [Mesorhizobium sp. WSM4962]MDG4920338.1 ATP-binding protein [Mesorhizobium sp. WSM4989]